MLNVVFFNSKTFLNKELLSALKRRTDMQVLCVNLPVMPPPEAAEAILDQLKPYLPAIIVSLNDAGFDQAGKLDSLLAKNGCCRLNWYYDDPLYEHIMYKRAIGNLSTRIDFVSEKSFVKVLEDKGFNSHFLPLAVDTDFFNTKEPKPEYHYDISFVGNSSLEFMDSLINEQIQHDIDKFKPLLTRLKTMYWNNPREDLHNYLYVHEQEWKNKITIDKDMFTFAMIWLAGYFYRKDFIVDIAKTFKEQFMCFGDIYWTKFIAKKQVSTSAMYYTNLCSYYRSTKINLNINRIQTQTSFTQRIFDCMASGAFLLTDKRQLNSEYFVTAGKNIELVEYNSLSECKKLIKYYLEHDDEREKIGMAGREKVLTFHKYDNRVAEMFSIAKSVWQF